MRSNNTTGSCRELNLARPLRRFRVTLQLFKLNNAPPPRLRPDAMELGSPAADELPRMFPVSLTFTACGPRLIKGSCSPEPEYHSFGMCT